MSASPPGDEAGSDPPTTPRSESAPSHAQTGGDSMSSDRSSSSAGPDSVHEGVMDTMSPRSAASKREPQTNASPVEESVEPASKHQRLIQAVQVNGDVLYTLAEQWDAYPGDGDEHLEAQWEESDDEMDWSNLKESDGPP